MLRSLASFALIAIASASGTTPGSRTASLTADVAKARHEARLPATAVIVVSGTRKMVQSVGGVAKITSRVPITANAHWHIGSAVKPFIAAMAVIEQEHGRVRLDAPVDEDVPAWRSIVSSGFKTVTLRYLLEHRAGVPPFTELTDQEIEELSQFKGTPSSQREAFARKILSGAPIDGVPSAKAHYSNAGYSIAAHILEHRTGKDWRVLLRQDVLRPAGAIDCFSGWPSTNRGEPSGHHLIDGKPMPVPPLSVPAVLAPAGHLTCSTDALAALAQWKLRQLETCPVHKEQCDWKLGLGQSVTKRNTRVFTILGSLDQFVVLMAFYPDDDRAVVIAANVGEENGGREQVIAISKIVRDAFNL